MKKWLKRIRGAVGLGLTWAAVWIGALTIFTVVTPGWTPSLVNLLANSVLFGAMGFIGGTVFSGVLGFVERRRTFHEMSLPRFATWGTLGGLLVSILLIVSGAVTGPTQVIGLGVAILLGAGSAAGSLGLARRADDGELLEDGADVADIGLTKEETHELLGA